MGASMQVFFHLSFLLVLFFRSTGGDDASPNPCSQFPCAEGSLCWNDNGTARCENACNSTRCEEGQHCVTEVGPCGNTSCRPAPHYYEPMKNTSDRCMNLTCPNGTLCWNDNGTARCENGCNSTRCEEGRLCVTEVGPCGNTSCPPTGHCYYERMRNTSDPCMNLTCPNGTECTIVHPIFPSGPMPMVICGPDPCAKHNCCRDAVGGVCEKDACYLRRAPSASIKDVRLEPWCANPCLLHDLQCDKPDEFCYKNRANCSTPPCNPVPVCRKPCSADPELLCGHDLKCEVAPATCLEEEEPGFEYWGTCQPTEYCVSDPAIKR